MVEAAGVEPFRHSHANRLMANDFRSLGSDSLPLLTVFHFTRVYSSPLHSTQVQGDIGETEPTPSPTDLTE